MTSGLPAAPPGPPAPGAREAAAPAPVMPPPANAVPQPSLPLVPPQNLQPPPPEQKPPSLLQSPSGTMFSNGLPLSGSPPAVTSGAMALVGEPVKVSPGDPPVKTSVAQGEPQATFVWKSVGGDLADPDARDAIAFSGIALLVLRSIALVWGLLMSGEEKLHFLGVIVYGASGLVCLWGLVALVHPASVPRGCDCAPACAGAQSGILSCPLVPWTLGLWGLLAVLVTIILWAVRGLTVLAIDVASGSLMAAFGFSWLGRLRCQDGHWCCGQAPRTTAAELVSPTHAAGSVPGTAP